MKWSFRTLQSHFIIVWFSDFRLRRKIYAISKERLNSVIPNIANSVNVNVRDFSNLKLEKKEEEKSALSAIWNLHVEKKFNVKQTKLHQNLTFSKVKRTWKRHQKSFLSQRFWCTLGRSVDLVVITQIVWYTQIVCLTCFKGLTFQLIATAVAIWYIG